MYQFLVALLRPFTLVFLLMLLWTAYLWWRRRAACRGLAVWTVLLVLLTVVCSPLCAYLALYSLEWPYAPRSDLPEGVDTVVVLSGSLQTYDETGEEVQLTSDTVARCRAAAALYRRAGRCRLLLSGGKVDPAQPGPTLARAMADFLAELGVGRSEIVLEETSTNTYENARNCREMLGKLGVRRIVLVTDAAHMRRAVGCFRAQGIEAVPAPCNYHATWRPITPATFLPDADAAGGVGVAWHEWLGVAWYWINGRL